MARPRADGGTPPAPRVQRVGPTEVADRGHGPHGRPARARSTPRPGKRRPGNGRGRRVCARRTPPNHRDVARRLHSVVRALTCFQRTQSRARDALAWPRRCPRGSPGEGSAPQGASTHLGHATPRRETLQQAIRGGGSRKCRCVYSCFSGLEAACERGSPAGREPSGPGHGRGRWLATASGRRQRRRGFGSGIPKISR